MKVWQEDEEALPPTHHKNLLRALTPERNYSVASYKIFSVKAMGICGSIKLLLRVQSLFVWAMDARYCVAPPSASTGQYATLNC